MAKALIQHHPQALHARGLVRQAGCRWWCIHASIRRAVQAGDTRDVQTARARFADFWIDQFMQNVPRRHGLQRKCLFWLAKNYTDIRTALIAAREPEALAAVGTRMLKHHTPFYSATKLLLISGFNNLLLPVILQLLELIKVRLIFRKISI